MHASSCVIRVSPRVDKTWGPISNPLLWEGEGGWEEWVWWNNNFFDSTHWPAAACSLSENKSTRFFREFSRHHQTAPPPTTAVWPQLEETRNAACFGCCPRLNTAAATFSPSVANVVGGLEMLHWLWSYSDRTHPAVKICIESLSKQCNGKEWCGGAIRLNGVGGGGRLLGLSCTEPNIWYVEHIQ